MENNENTAKTGGINCETAGDLLPLYVDEVLSPSSTALVEEHLAECESCTQKLNALKKATTVKDYDGVKPMKKFKDKLRRHKIVTGVTVGVCAAILLGLFLYFFEYTYSYDQLKNDIEVVSDADGHIHIVYHGDKVLFSKYDISVVGVKDGKAQCKLSLYESVNFYDWWTYYFDPSLMTGQERKKGKTVELFHVCPNDPFFGAGCRTCMNDDRFVLNSSMGKDGGLEMEILSNFDKPNPYSELEWDTLDWVNSDTMPYDAYEEMALEICYVEYRQFNNSFLDRYKGTNLWIREDIPYVTTGKQSMSF